MAKPTVIAGTKLLLLVGDGATPEVFAEPCGLTTKSFDLSASTNSNLIPDCANPEGPAWESTDINGALGLGLGIRRDGVESFDAWNDWFLSAEGKNMQIKLDHASLGYYSGFFKLTSFKLSGSRGNKVLVDLSFKSDGEVSWT
jgi:hypothetical protein